MTSLTTATIEHIHDVLVAVLMPFDEEVRSDDYRDRGKIEASLARPLATVFGDEAWPTLDEKAAVLFHSFVCNHCFINGNKRTAVIALDLFLAMNGRVLLSTQDEVYELARSTATANSNGFKTRDVIRDLAEKIGCSAVDSQQVAVAMNDAGQAHRFERTVSRLLQYLTTAQE